MSRRRPPHTEMSQMYILTDAEGFTTICDATRECLFKEASRVPLLAPIAIVHWLRTSDPFRGNVWRRASDWTWNGGLEVGA